VVRSVVRLVILVGLLVALTAAVGTPTASAQAPMRCTELAAERAEFNANIDFLISQSPGGTAQFEAARAQGNALFDALLRQAGCTGDPPLTCEQLFAARAAANAQIDAFITQFPQLAAQLEQERARINFFYDALLAETDCDNPYALPTAVARIATSGSTLGFSLNSPATVGFSLDRRVGRDRYRRVGTFRAAGHQGRNRIRIPRVLVNGRRVGKGVFRLSARAVNGGGRGALTRRVVRIR
jgi:hypothetical protein